MTFIDVLLTYLLLHFIHSAGMLPLYRKGGYSLLQAIVPVYNLYILLRMIGRPWWWLFLFFVPIVNNVMIVVCWVETLMHFGRKGLRDAWVAVLTLGLYFYYVSYVEKGVEYKKLHPRPKPTLFSSLIFAVVVASIIRTFTFQAYIIPTSSMEKTMRVGDFLVVNKYKYGVRLPLTPLSVPLVHDKIPFTDLPSYLQWMRLPLMRLPALQEIERNDIVVFNYPMDEAPIDKKSNYVKRCIAIAGDTLFVESGRTYVNSEEVVLPQNAEGQYSYVVTTTSNTPLSQKILSQRYEITDPIYQLNAGRYRVILTDSMQKVVQGFTSVAAVDKLITPTLRPESNIFPAKVKKNWNVDHLGPIYVPKAGDVLQLGMDNIYTYERLIRTYEGNFLEIKSDSIYINGKLTNQYQVKQDYYWMMGDNRHNSLDSRYWGFVPHDHILGSPSLIFMSWNAAGANLMDKIRWDRMMMYVDNEPERSYFWGYFIGIIALFYGISFYSKRREKKKKQQDADKGDAHKT